MAEQLVGTVHAPAVQICPAAQTLPHPLQLFGSVSLFDSQPSSLTPLQSLVLAAQTPMAHTPARQSVTATLVSVGHAVQLPQ